MNEFHEGSPCVHYGTPVVSGVAWAPSAWARRPTLPAQDEAELTPDQRPGAIDAYMTATDVVAQRLFERAEHSEGSAAEVLAVTASMATDKSWRKETVRYIEAGVPAVQAVVRATAKLIDSFERAGGILAERTTDLRDVRDRVIAELRGEPEPGIPRTDHPVVLLADDLSPADTAGLDPSMYSAIVTEFGGPTSHTSIIARQLGIPCIVAARTIGQIAEGVHVLVDAHTGTITTGARHCDAHDAVAHEAERLAAIRAWHGPGRTRDDVRVELLANVQDDVTTRLAAHSGDAEGIGLFRTELYFLNTQVEPSVDDQAVLYGKVMQEFPESKVVVRTLDSGSDKPVPFAPLLEEANPALGVRGIRTTGHNQEFLPRQLDAIRLAASSVGHEHVRVMAPMISTVAETQWFAGLVHDRGLKAGIMVEVPSVAIMIDKFAPLVDFVSIGTNDLTQYVMAADRMSPHLAEYTDPWQPSVLRLIAHTAKVCCETGTDVCVCGEAAADPLLACVLVGMGVQSLSMACPAIPPVGARLASVTLEQCQAASVAIREATSPGEARHFARTQLPPLASSPERAQEMNSSAE
ncbi:MAG: putative PEP-binding protein [Actinomyces sp.]|nr:putative PEP-binding protein [Actinomyces sp.]